MLVFLLISSLVLHGIVVQPASSSPVVMAMAEGPDLNHMSFVGMVGMCDPPRETVAASVFQLMEGGVSVKMITGDAQETAESIG